jgi:hypothetical protein
MTTAMVRFPTDANCGLINHLCQHTRSRQASRRRVPDLLMQSTCADVFVIDHVEQPTPD